jgi:hypothetical protein
MRLRDHDYGPVTNPLPILIDPRRPGDMPSIALAALLKRRIGDGRMKRFRSVPVERRAWYVTLTKTFATEEALRGKLVSDTAFDPQRFWVRARRVARWYVNHDQKAGGSGTAFSVECRHCRVCGRVLVAEQAHSYRERMRWPKFTWHYPEGPACSVDCKPPEIKRNSKNRSKHA